MRDFRNTTMPVASRVGTSSCKCNGAVPAPNQQDAAMLWYHDHALGINRLNVYAGLLGTFVNSADDFINPPELGVAEREIKKVKNGKFVLLPASEQTHGHGTHTWAAAWQRYLKELLEESSPKQ